MKHEIKIVTATEFTDKLDLRIRDVNADDIEVNKLHIVTWSIVAANVEWFRIVPKNGSDDIFTSLVRPSSKPTKSTKGWVSILAKEGDLFDYSIIWRSNQDNEDHVYDPQISVKPSFTNLPLPIIAVVVGVVALALLFTQIRRR